jgi:hypothetical protein
MSVWGWTPESFGAVGTVGALAATATVLLREALGRTRAQAEKLIVWIDRMDSPGPDSRDIGLFLHIKNDSTNPIHDIEARLADGKSTRFSPVIGPGVEQHHGLDVVVTGTVSFTDSAGRRWRRPIGKGRPRRVYTRAPASGG